ncbi:MAG TPA: hypothetical protein DCM40_19435 [Maribacter sp.]|nr:hypothetical protein [Maribacter sp.]|tara:strand:+ start:229 stop:564 length:336 start_codon:yes stop_codon:yes gene_type:complete
MSENIEWFENQIIWDSLDALVKNCSTDLKNLLDALWEHKNEIDENTQVSLFIGLGGFVKSYSEARNELNEPLQSFAHAVEKVFTHPAYEKMVMKQMTDKIDEKVVQFKEGN